MNYVIPLDSWAVHKLELHLLSLVRVAGNPCIYAIPVTVEREKRSTNAPIQLSKLRNVFIHSLCS